MAYFPKKYSDLVILKPKSSTIVGPFRANSDVPPINLTTNQGKIERFAGFNLFQRVAFASPWLCDRS